MSFCKIAKDPWRYGFRIGRELGLFRGHNGRLMRVEQLGFIGRAGALVPVTPFTWRRGCRKVRSEHLFVIPAEAGTSCELEAAAAACQLPLAFLLCAGSPRSGG